MGENPFEYVSSQSDLFCSLNLKPGDSGERTRVFINFVFDYLFWISKSSPRKFIWSVSKVAALIYPEIPGLLWLSLR